MTTRSDLNALADRVEREKASRYLDQDIEEATRGYVTDQPLYYTASLDAAVTLVPDNGEAIWYLFSDWPGDVFWARVEFDRDAMDLPRKYKSKCCPSPALALCAAALRARAADMQARADDGAPQQKGSEQ